MFPVLPRTAAALAAATLVPGLVVGFVSTPAQAGIIGCGAFSPTIVGTEGADQLEGTENSDVIYGLGGDDTINALGGDDIVCGGEGADTIDGGDGLDQVYGEAGQDEVAGGGDDDTVDGGDDDDILYGDAGSDLLGGGAGNDRLLGGLDNDRMIGGPDGDFVVYYFSERGVTVDLRANAGATNGNASDGPVGARDDLASVEGVFGSEFKDVLSGNSKKNYFRGASGRDLVKSRGGDDLIEVADGQVDHVTCGGGEDDEVTFDKRIDSVRGCEDKAAVVVGFPRMNDRAGLSDWTGTAAR